MFTKYESIKIKRRAARDRINKLELEIKELEVQLNNLTNNEEINHEDNG